MGQATKGCGGLQRAATRNSADCSGLVDGGNGSLAGGLGI
jgi:hypothetical protein